MNDRKLITFFMLVTERDCIIADYSIKSYQRVYDEHQKFGFRDFTLYIYLNCLSEKSKNRYLETWTALPYTVLFDNAAKNISAPYPGEQIISPENISRSRDDYAESYDELWTTELRKFTTPYVATVDADFEILNPDFYFDLINQLGSNSSLIAASSSYSPTSFLFDTYSQRNIWLQERNHTWFCIYKKEAFDISSISHFYYEEKSSNGEIIAYDSAAYFQHDLRVNHRLGLVHSASTFSGSFVHYGAASKNKSLNEQNIGFYRKAFILCTIGLFTGSYKNPFKTIANFIARRIALRKYQGYLSSITAERSTYVF